MEFKKRKKEIGLIQRKKKKKKKEEEEEARVRAWKKESIVFSAAQNIDTSLLAPLFWSITPSLTHFLHFKPNEQIKFKLLTKKNANSEAWEHEKNLKGNGRKRHSDELQSSGAATVRWAGGA